VGKCCTVGQDILDNIIRRMRFACWITKATDTQTLGMCSTYLLLCQGNRVTLYVLSTPYIACLVSCTTGHKQLANLVFQKTDRHSKLFTTNVK